jgi:hypothetical protein
MLSESLSALGILGITILFLNPTHLTMPESVQSMLTLGLIVTFLIFAALIFREQASDERESMHRLISGRISYLAGVGTLITGLIIQASMHEIDKWLVIALCVMVLSKLLTRIYSQWRM